MLEHSRTISGNVFVEQDARLAILQQPRQRSLAIEKRAIAQILTIVLDQVEGVRARGPRSLASTQLVEARQTVRPQHHCLAVDREALGLDALGGGSDSCQSCGQVNRVARIEPQCRPCQQDPGN
jgi:hypothetical protein